MRVYAHRISQESGEWFVNGFGIRGKRTDLRRWAALCGHEIVFCIPRFAPEGK